MRGMIKKSFSKMIAMFIALSMVLTVLPLGADGRIYAGNQLEPPKAIAIAANSITLEQHQGYMYRMDDGEWTENNVFTGLQKQTSYTFYQRQGEDAGTESNGIIIVTSDHNHEWVITAEGNTITAECRNSDGNHIGETASSIIINKPERTVYGGSGSPEATLSGSIDNVPNPAIVYKKDGDLLNGAPENAGEYTAEITIAGTTASVEYTIERKPVSLKADDLYKYEGDKDPELSASATGLTGNDTVTYTSIFRQAGDAAGTYTITVTGDEIQGNYKVTFEPGTLTIIERPKEEKGDDPDDEPEEEPTPSPTPDPTPSPTPEPTPAPTPAPNPTPAPTPAPEPELPPEPEDPVIPSPDVGIRIPTMFRLLRKAGVKNVISGNQIVLYAPRDTISFNGRSHIKKEGGSSTNKKIADLTISVDGIPDVITEKYYYKKNKNASNGACYYISLKVNKGSSDWALLSDSDKSSLKKALKDANKTLKQNKVYFTIQKLNLSEFEFDNTTSQKNNMVFRRKDGSGDWLAVKQHGGKKHYIENLQIKEKHSSGYHVEAFIQGKSFKISGSEYSKSEQDGGMTITGAENNLTGSVTGKLAAQ